MSIFEIKIQKYNTPHAQQTTLLPEMSFLVKPSGSEVNETRLLFSALSASISSPRPVSESYSMPSSRTLELYVMGIFHIDNWFCFFSVDPRKMGV
jgi:hypothetical protein